VGIVYIDDACGLCGHLDHLDGACSGDPHTGAPCVCGAELCPACLEPAAAPPKGACPSTYGQFIADWNGDPTDDPEDEGLLRDDD
jgi:hypothetical protein